MRSTNIHTETTMTAYDMALKIKINRVWNSAWFSFARRGAGNTGFFNTAQAADHADRVVGAFMANEIKRGRIVAQHITMIDADTTAYGFRNV